MGSQMGVEQRVSLSCQIPATNYHIPLKFLAFTDLPSLHPEQPLRRPRRHIRQRKSPKSHYAQYNDRTVDTDSSSSTSSESGRSEGRGQSRRRKDREDEV